MRFVRKLFLKGRGSGFGDKTTGTGGGGGALRKESVLLRLVTSTRKSFENCDYFCGSSSRSSGFSCAPFKLPALCCKSLSSPFSFCISCHGLHTLIGRRRRGPGVADVYARAGGGALVVEEKDKSVFKSNTINSTSAIIPPTTPTPAKAMATTPLANDEALLASCRAFIPSLTNAMHKGQAGRIGVVGGSVEYTGAPYFAAISALKVGADLAHVFCPKPAATVIKSYSPELIVHPLLDADNAVDAIMDWAPRLHSIVIGPGLGRDPKTLHTVAQLIERLKELEKLIILDADALHLIKEQPNLIKGYPKVILTPNSVEFAHLCTAVLGEEVKPAPSASAEKVRELANAFGNVTILHKGATDVASNGRLTVCCAGGGSNRRCGGQGDLLAGSLAVLFHWATGFGDRATAAAPPELLAVYGACRLTRECARLAYSQHGRSTTTTEMVRLIHQAFSFLFGP